MPELPPYADPDFDESRLSKTEHIKKNSRQFRGTIAEELREDTNHFNDENIAVLKHHGTYQQDDRDLRNAKLPDGTPAGKHYMFMVRTRIPGGKVTAHDLLTELDLCDTYGNGTLRVTSRQGFQLHGILKRDLWSTIHGINTTKLSTISACGDVSRNTMCCPAPYKHSPIHDELQATAAVVAEHLKYKSTAYYDIWVRDPDSGEETKVSEFKPVEEPIYGERYLPRKFKVGFALPEDNCIDVYAQDLGYLAVVENGEIVGYNILVGGSMGMTPANKETFPAVAHRMTYVPKDQVIPIAEAVVKVQRDYGNREDRKLARMKYLIARWGLPKFKAMVEEYYGAPLPEPHPTEVTGVDDHKGWHAQGDGKWFLGIHIENGRIKDEGDYRMKTAIRTIVEKYRMDVRTTPLQDLILCDVAEADKPAINRILREHGVPMAEELTQLARLTNACPALPTCGLSVTESERVHPNLVREIQAVLDENGLHDEPIAVHMTGCPNGCARPYTGDIGVVGKGRLKYTLYLGGNTNGTRIGFIYDDMVPLAEIPGRLSPLLAYFKSERLPGECFGDFCHRKGLEDLKLHAQPVEAPASVSA